LERAAQRGFSVLERPGTRFWNGFWNGQENEIEERCASNAESEMSFHLPGINLWLRTATIAASVDDEEDVMELQS
jgi:hypothetical protein